MDHYKDQVRVVNGSSEAMIWGPWAFKNHVSKKGKMWFGIGMLVCHGFLD